MEQDSEVFLGGSDADVEDTWTWSKELGEPNNQNGDEDYLTAVINWDWKCFDGIADATYYM